MSLRIVFEDEDVVVVDKPAGMVVNRSQTSQGGTVQDWAERNFNDFLVFKNSEFGEKGGVVHRLDKDTSGLLVLAKNPEAYNALKKQFLERTVQKKYTALVHGKMPEPAGVISLPIERHPKVWGKFAVGRDLARTAITEWKVEGYYSRFNAHYTLLELKPVTGRTHQLRVHLKHLGHPVVSDPLYSGRRQLEQDRQWCPRLFLHASRLEIAHPGSGEKLIFNSGLPTDLAQA